MDEPITIQEKAQAEAQQNELEEFYRKFGVEEKGIDNFFLEIVRAEDTTKIGNITEDELGTPPLPIRTLKELANDCDLIPSMSSFAKSFRTESENILASSLSKEGFLIKARITQKKEFLEKSKKKRRAGLFGFGKKEEPEEIG